MLLEADSEICLSISVTTRPMRPGEVDGKDYIFVDQAAFVITSYSIHYTKLYDNSGTSATDGTSQHDSSTRTSTATATSCSSPGLALGIHSQVQAKASGIGAR